MYIYQIFCSLVSQPFYDKKKNKCTYVTKYELDVGKKTLQKITNEAIQIISSYGEKGEFLKKLAIFIETREK